MSPTSNNKKQQSFSRKNQDDNERDFSLGKPVRDRRNRRAHERKLDWKDELIDLEEDDNDQQSND
jgi:hypothetical protein